MIEYQITDVKPNLIDGHLFSLSFNVWGVENDLKEGLSFNTPASLPDRVEPYAESDFAELANQISSSAGLYDALKVKIQSHNPAPPPPVAPVHTISDSEQKTIWMTTIDNTIASVYNQFTRFQMEYELREKAALDYKNSDYTGEPTMWIKSFADNTNISYRQCADVVLAQASKLRGAVALLGQLRMDKYKVLSASTLEDAKIAFDSIINQTKRIAGSL